jgi:hypothetical protein
MIPCFKFRERILFFAFFLKEEKLEVKSGRFLQASSSKIKPSPFIKKIICRVMPFYLI